MQERNGISGSDVVCCAHDATGTRLATVDGEGTIREWVQASGGSYTVIWECASGHKRGTSVTAVCYAPPKCGAGAYVLATSGTDGAVAVYKRDTGAHPAVLRDAPAPVRALAWGVGGLAASGDDGRVRIYRRSAHTSTGAWRCIASVIADGPALDWAGDYLIAGTLVYAKAQDTGYSCVWRKTDTRLPKGTCASVAQARDGALVAIGCDDGSVWLGAPNRRDSETLVAPVKNENEGPKKVSEVHWDRTASMLAVVHVDGVVRTWIRAPSMAQNGIDTFNKIGGAPWQWTLNDVYDATLAEV